MLIIIMLKASPAHAGEAIHVTEIHLVEIT
jgi:hypothetical protein